MTSRVFLFEVVVRCVCKIKPEYKIKPEFLQISFRPESPTQTRVFISFLLPLNMSFETLDARIDAAATMCTPSAYYFTKLLLFKTNILSKVLGRGPRTHMRKLLIIVNSR